MVIEVNTDSQVYSFPVSISSAVRMYLRMTPFLCSAGGWLQLSVTEFESITLPLTLTGESLGAVFITKESIHYTSINRALLTILIKLNRDTVTKWPDSYSLSCHRTVVVVERMKVADIDLR